MKAEEKIMDNCPFTGKPCDNSKNIHIKYSSNENEGEYICCEQCAMMSKVSNILSLLLPTGMALFPLPMSTPQNYLSSNLQKLENMDKAISPAEKTCEGCGSSISDIKSMQKLGCPQCYNSHREQIDMLLPQIHMGAKKHVGKKPKGNVEQIKETPPNGIEQMKKEMQKAVQEERYEDAAKFRDQIRALEQTL
jgi:protein-arginine kinase activator protein McsA